MHYKNLSITENHPLANQTTFKIGGPAKYFITVKNTAQLKNAYKFATDNKLSVFIIGNGSNILVNDKSFNGLVIKNNIKSFRQIKKTPRSTYIEIGSGELWQNILTQIIKQNLWGIENLSGIPGTFGGIIVQNAGAYGQDISQTLTSVKVLNLASLKIEKIAIKKLNLNYRSSIFTSSKKGKYFILNGTLKLSNKPKPKLDYPDLQQKFPKPTKATLNAIHRYIILTRNTKIPPLDKHPSAGSFFKNFSLNPSQLKTINQTIKQNFSIKNYQKFIDISQKYTQQNLTKIPTAFIIDICGLKNAKYKQAHLAKTAPIVIITSGSSSASDVLHLFKNIRQSIYQKTGLKVIPEPQLIGFTQAELKPYFSLTN